MLAARPSSCTVHQVGPRGESEPALDAPSASVFQPLAPSPLPAISQLGGSAGSQKKSTETPDTP